jgi:transposase InsO family protein
MPLSPAVLSPRALLVLTFRAFQGSQFTGQTFTGALAGNGIAISMDGKGAWRDNVFVERLWRSVKYEEVYLRQRQRSSCFDRPVF